MRVLSLISRNVGRFAVFLSCIYIFSLFVNNENTNISEAIFPSGPAFLICTIIFIISNFLAANAWKNVTDPTQKHLTCYKTTCSIWSLSNVAKYLPGNVFHYVSRFNYCQRLGVDNVKTSLGLFAEVFTVSLSALVLCIPSLVTGTFSDSYPNNIKSFINWNNSLIVWYIGTLSLVAATLLFYFGSKSHKANKHIQDVFQHICELSSKWLEAFLCCLLSFTLVGLAAYVTLDFNKIEISGLTIATLTAAYSLAFILGYVIPGAPGGLGIREAILIALLTPYIGAPAAISLAATLRLASIVADIFGAIFFSFISNKDYRSESPS